MNQRTRLHQRQQARAASNRPDLSAYRANVAQEAAPSSPAPHLSDAPEIPSKHPASWQVHRCELLQGRKRYVLIAELRTEDEAFAFVHTQASCCRISRWNDRRQPYESFRPPRVVDPE